MVAAAVSETTSTVDSQNPNITCNPLLTSGTDNRSVTSDKQKKAKSRIVSSRYMSPSICSAPGPNSSLDSSYLSPSVRSPSLLVSRNSTPFSNGHSLGPKRSASVDKRRPTAAKTSTPDLDVKNGNAADVLAAKKHFVTSTRRLSVSFQGEGFSLPISKTKVTPQPNLSSVRKGTHERRRTGTPLGGKGDSGGDQIDFSKLLDQHRWPTGNPLVNRLSRSLNYGIGEETCELIGSGDAIQELRQSVIDERRPSLDSRLDLVLGSSEILNAVQRAPDGKESSLPSELIASDSDSVSSGSTSGVHESGGASQGNNCSGRIVDLAQFWLEMNSRLRRLQDPPSPLSSNTGSRILAPPKLNKYTGGGIRAASPCKLMSPIGSSPSRGYSPSRIRNAVSTICNNFVETPSVLSFAVDIRRGKVGENQILDAHLLRLLYNRHLQWRSVNARTVAGLLVQKHNLEKNLWNAWITISDLRDTVTKKRHRLQLLKRKLKLAFILKGQVTLLEDWDSMGKDHSFSLVGAIEALKGSTLRLPATGGATADIQSLKDAIGSAVDVVHAVTSSICSFQPTVQNTKSLAAELAKVTGKERALLEQCTDFISSLADTQVKDNSLRTHILQHNRVTPA
ncbi:QWRF motif-containing protein 2-like [Dorcoceras hygrometricum]|uniref:QWRF motif-containing protein 2-like n=2 Tax=Dorcoceras hygrometricum TaxID=472368 RepID=A0A2Z7DHS1_9LAMI|nr:QWRF motif-containing protein 2-like [Dorcoceras hygrometricum]